MIRGLERGLVQVYEGPHLMTVLQVMMEMCLQVLRESRNGATSESV